jgi:hypothetical protein
MSQSRPTPDSSIARPTDGVGCGSGYSAAGSRRRACASPASTPIGLPSPFLHTRITARALQDLLETLVALGQVHRNKDGCYSFAG